MKNTKLLLLSCFAAALFFSACDKDGRATSALSITVTDGVTATASAGATIKLYDDINNATSGASPNYTETADASGKAKFTVDYTGIYYVVVENGTKKNWYSGLIPVGVFKTQADIDASPAQTPVAIIGSVKFQDTNGDGVINESDKTKVPGITLFEGTTPPVSITIY